MPIEQLKDSAGRNIVVKAGSSNKITATLKDYADVAINKASLLTLTMTLRDANMNYVKRGETDINGLSIKDANGGYVTNAGILSLYLTGSDNTPLSPGLAIEERILLITYTWNDGVDAANQTGVAEYRYTVDRTTDAT